MMFLSSGHGNGSDTVAANALALVDAYGCWEEVEKGWMAIAHLWAELWTMV
jgi:ADP-ribosylglycohydrolase